MMVNSSRLVRGPITALSIDRDFDILYNYIPGVASNLYSSWGSVIILVSVLLFLSVIFPHIVLRQSFARPRLTALGLIDSL
jgi:hypothetical protein